MSVQTPEILFPPLTSKVTLASHACFSQRGLIFVKGFGIFQGWLRGFKSPVVCFSLFFALGGLYLVTREGRRGTCLASPCSNTGLASWA